MGNIGNGLMAIALLEKRCIERYSEGMCRKSPTYPIPPHANVLGIAPSVNVKAIEKLFMLTSAFGSFV